MAFWGYFQVWMIFFDVKNVPSQVQTFWYIVCLCIHHALYVVRPSQYVLHCMSFVVCPTLYVNYGKSLQGLCLPLDVLCFASYFLCPTSFVLKQTSEFQGSIKFCLSNITGPEHLILILLL